MRTVGVFWFFVVSLMALEPVSIDLKWHHQAQFAGYYVAKERGFYAAEGLSVTLNERTQGVDNVRRVLEGKSDYAITDTSIILRYLHGDPVVLIAPIFQYSPLVFLTLEKSGINAPADLRGKRVMLYEDGLEGIPLKLMLKMEGVNINDVTLIPPSFDHNDLVKGRTDALFAYSTNEPFLLAEAGVQTRAIDPKSYGINFYEDILFTSKQEATLHPDRVNKIRRATLKGWAWALENPQKTVDLIARHYSPGKSREALAYELSEVHKLIRPDIFEIGQINRTKLTAIADSLVDLGLATPGYSLEGLVFDPQAMQAPLALSAAEKAFLAEHPRIQMGIDIDWAPFEYVNGAGTHQGMAADYLELVGKRLGVQFEPRTDLSWQETLAAAQNREVDILSCAVATPQREAFMEFTTPYLSFPMTIATDESISHLRDPQDLIGQPVGVVDGYASEDIIRRHYPELSLVTFESVGQGLTALSKGSIYAFVGNLATISHEIRTRGLTNLKISGEFPHRYELSIGVRPDWPLLSSAIQKALESITPKEHDDIYYRWIRTRFERPENYAMLWRVASGALLIVLAIGWWNRRLAREVKRRKEAEERFKALSESTFQAIGVHRDGKIIEVNHATEEIFGYSREALIGMDPLMLFSPEGQAIVAGMIQSGSEESYEALARHKEGHTFPVELHARNVIFEGRPARVTSIRDITQQVEAQKALRAAKALTDRANEELQKRVESEVQRRRKQEQLLIQQSKMAAMGEMIAAIAHQWKQPLTILSLLVQDLVETQKEGALDSSYLKNTSDQCIHQIEFMSQTINDFRNFLKPTKTRVSFDVLREIYEIERLFGRQLKKHNITLKIHEPEGSAPTAVGYPNEFKQVLLNIINNARDAIATIGRAQGVITIDFKECDQMLCIEVEDNGGGIEAVMLEKLFNPYESTKGDGGTGIGLYLAKTIIEESMCGQITAENTLEGARFSLCLPLSQKPL
jgi:PAS domain S-box-containing protein